MVRRLVVLAAAASTWCGMARAEERPLSLWYRSAEGCPNAEAFIALLAGRGVTAKLAQVGDAIDFVVTLGSGPDGAKGLLERQTEAKTVAIRKLDGGTCDQVADAIALSLVVANTPRADEPPAAPPAANENPPADAPSSYVSTVSVAPSRNATPRPATSRRPRWSTGFNGGALFGISPEPMITVSVFGELELDFPDAGAFHAPVFRVWAFEALSAGSSEALPASTFIGAGKAEACPVGIKANLVSARPCVAVDLGTIATAGNGRLGATDHGIWASADLGVRVGFQVLPPLTVELRAAAVIPFERYDFASVATGTTYQTSSIGINLGAGASVQLP